MWHNDNNNNSNNHGNVIGASNANTQNGLQNNLFAHKQPLASGSSRQFGADLTANQNQNHHHHHHQGKKKTLKPVTTNNSTASTSTSTSTSTGISHTSANVDTTTTTSSSSSRNNNITGGRFENIDEIDRLDPQAVAEYSHDIHQHYRSSERLHMPAADYMNRQKSINVKMRAILVDWLVEVHLKFKLMPETLYLTINLIDRYLAKQPCKRHKLQLVGVTCMLLASKYEEIYFPEVQDFVYITDHAYTRFEILKMEGVVLNALHFDLTVPTALPFLKRFLKASKADSRVTYISHFFTERMLQEYTMLGHTASEIAASAVSMALRVCHRPAWSQTLQHYSGYTLADLDSCINRMSRIVLNAPKVSLQAIRKKYSSHKYGSASMASFSRLFNGN